MNLSSLIKIDSTWRCNDGLGKVTVISIDLSLDWPIQFKWTDDGTVGADDVKGFIDAFTPYFGWADLLEDA